MWEFRCRPLGTGPVPVFASTRERADTTPLFAIKLGARAGVVARPEWVDLLRPIVADLDPDLLFSTFGTYELARVTLPHGVTVWGPSWFFLADERTWRPVDGLKVKQLEQSEMAEVDYNIFFNCFPAEAMAGFGVFDGARPIALAGVRDYGDPVWEIGMNVAGEAQGRGLGRAVVSAAVGWTLDNCKLALAITGAFNVPSARTLRSVGFRYMFSRVYGADGVFQVPPQALGRPYPSAEVYDYFPRSAMNRDILPRPSTLPGGS